MSDIMNNTNIKMLGRRAKNTAAHLELVESSAGESKSDIELSDFKADNKKYNSNHVKG